MKSKYALTALACLLLGLATLTDVFGNLWGLLTGRGFIIPEESSVLKFRVTTLNQGSGEWWEYGEDERYYYYFTGEGKPPYKKFAKADEGKCKGFQRSNHLTWCGS